MLEDVKLIHETLLDLEEALAAKPARVIKARALASRLHRLLHEGTQ